MIKFDSITQFQIIKSLSRPKEKTFMVSEYLQAKHIKTDKLYAIKKIQKLPNYVNDDCDDYKELENQITLLSQLNHKNIIKYEDCLQQDPYIYLIFEYVQCKLSKQKRNLTDKNIAEVLMQLCQALQYLHNKNILHRDINITNILLSYQPNGVEIKLIDFQYAGDLKFPRYTQCGSLDSLSPQVIAKEKQTVKVDIWGVGVIMYELMLKESAFMRKGGDPESLEERTRKKILNIDYEEVKGIDSDAKQLIEQILVRKPFLRPTLKQIMRSNFIKKYIGEKAQENIINFDAFSEVSSPVSKFGEMNSPMLSPNPSKFKPVIEPIKKKNNPGEISLFIKEQFDQIDQNPKTKKDLIKRVIQLEQSIPKPVPKPKELVLLEKKYAELESAYKMQVQNSKATKTRLKQTELQCIQLEKDRRELEEYRLNYEKSKLKLAKLTKSIKNTLDENKLMVARIKELQMSIKKTMQETQSINSESKLESPMKTRLREDKSAKSLSVKPMSSNSLSFSSKNFSKQNQLETAKKKY